MFRWTIFAPWGVPLLSLWGSKRDALTAFLGCRQRCPGARIAGGPARFRIVVLGVARDRGGPEDNQPDVPKARH